MSFGALLSHLAIRFDAVILHYGENSYEFPHLGKEAILRTEGILAMREQARQASELAVDIVMEFFLGDI